MRTPASIQALLLTAFAAAAGATFAQEARDRHHRFGHVRALIFAYEGNIVKCRAHGQGLNHIPPVPCRLPKNAAIKPGNANLPIESGLYSPPDMNSLDARSQILLKTLIERYIADGQPVGSRALSRFSGLELSPATVRNESSSPPAGSRWPTPPRSRTTSPTSAR